MFSRKLNWHNLKMSIETLIKLPKLYYDVIILNLKLKPDILYFANHHELILLLPIFKFIRKPIVCHMHDPAAAIPFQKFTFKWYGKYVKSFIAISENVKKRTIDLGARPDSVTVIYNGIHLPIIAEARRGDQFIERYNWPKESFILGITGQMTPTKGHEEVIRAVASLSDKYPSLRLVVGGKANEPYFSYLNSLLIELGIQDKVVFSGWLPDVNDFFKQIDIFILSSRHDEGYGLVVAEAMSCCKPVIATCSGGVVEIVENGRTGFLIHKKNVDELISKIEIFLLNPELCFRMGQLARERIELHFNIKEKIYEFKEHLIQCSKL
jgi:glycosyltransferase involved in cell wall biosynthesis